MVVNEYLSQKLKTCWQYNYSEEDNKLLNTYGLEEFIYKKIVSKKFRKWSISPETQTRTRKAVQINISQKSPLKFTFPFGGYKLWRLPTSPEVDWAEFFTLAYYCQYLAPILSIYKPGVVFYFSSDDIIIERMDNIPQHDTNAYFSSFCVLLDSFRQYFPANLHMEIKRVSNFYNQQGFEDELKTLIEKTKQDWLKYDSQKKQKLLKTSELNIKWNGTQDWTKLNKKEEQKIIDLGPIYHDAYVNLSKRRAFVRGEDKIVIFTNPIPNAIALGSTKTSVTKFWTGIGVLEKEEDQLFDRVFSPSQWELAQKDQYQTEKMDLIPLKNLEKIYIFEKRFNFANQKYEI